MARSIWIRLIAGGTAVIGWSALALQLAIMLGAMPLIPALWRFIGFFTILTNVLAAAMATRIAAGRPGGLASPAARMAVTASILLVGLAYWLLLAPLWTPTGSQLAADIALHSVQPVLVTGLWLMMRDGSLGWSDVPKAAIWPALYALYALARGTIDRWYAYWFLNPKDQSLGELLLSIAGLAVLVMAVGAVLVAIDRTRRARD